MPSDSVAAFLELARELRLLPDADLAPLSDTPEAVELPDVCERLIAAGTLTRYQAVRLLTGRGYTLGVGGFVLTDELDDLTALAVEATGRTAVRLARIPTDFRPPARSPHPAVAVPVTVGDGLAVFRTPDGAHLSALVSDMGPMPALLAAEYTRQAAAALAAVHAGGGVHGGVRPERLFVGPLVQASKPKPDGSPRYRPGPTAGVSLNDYGLPTDRTPADDVFGLGGVLFLLLTGREPGGASLSASRPDCPPELVSLAKGMLALAPADRPSAAEVATRLAAVISPNGQADAVRLGKESDPAAVPVENVTLAETEQVELVDEPKPLAIAGGWAGHPAMVPPLPPAVAFTPPAWAPPPAVESPFHAEEEETPVSPRRSRAANPTNARRELWVWVGAFLGLVALGLLVWVAMFLYMSASNKPRGSATPIERVS